MTGSEADGSDGGRINKERQTGIKLKRWDELRGGLMMEKREAEDRWREGENKERCHMSFMLRGAGKGDTFMQRPTHMCLCAFAFSKVCLHFHR